MRVGALLPALLVLLSLLHSTLAQTVACSITEDIVKGCLSCPTSSVAAINVSSSKLVCSSVTSCIAVLATGQCVECGDGLVLDLLDSTCASGHPGCITLSNATCLECSPSLYRLASNGTCVLWVIDYCWASDSTGCTECADDNMLTASNCSIPSTACTTFDYVTWTCLACPASTTLHPSGIFCYSTTIANCRVVSQSGCLECDTGYYISGTSCASGIGTNLFSQLLPADYSLNTTSYSTVNLCLELNSTFNSTSSLCQATSTTPLYCTTSASSTNCTTCFTGFYSSPTTSLCLLCRDTYSNCLTCDQYNCLQCQPKYYLALQLGSYNLTQFFNGQVTTSVWSCLPCYIYSCQYCRNQFQSSGANRVLCDECLFGYTLYNYTCYQCSEGQYFSVEGRNCSSCQVANCMYCGADPAACQQCTSSFYYDSATSTCQDISLVYSSVGLTAGNAYEVLNKTLPLSSTTIYNNQKLLITSCADSSNGYACLCSSATTTSVTALCQPISASLSGLTLLTSIVGTNTTTLTKSDFITNRILLQMMSQLPQYAFTYTPATGDLLSDQEMASYLQITTNRIRNDPTNAGTRMLQVAQSVLTDLYKAFSPYSDTVFAGPGYYFKYTPDTATSQDNTVLTVSGTTLSSLAIVLFNSTVNATQPRITGTAFVYVNGLVDATLTLTLKKIGFLGEYEEYTVLLNDATSTLSASSDTDGFLTLTGISASTGSVSNAYYVSSVESTAIRDAYSDQRIQNILYQDAFIYILVFVTLYLVLIPVCALTDCVDNKSTKRRVHRSDSSSYQGVRRDTQQSEEEEVVLHINYKDFFPIYNVANTARPKRFLKLCLFIANLQHSVTFLVLIYFNFAEGQALAAVILAIPAYLCTIIMGYLCGLMVVCLPGHTKYLINILPLGYWAVWISLFPKFTADDYKPFVYTFMLIFFGVDMLIDCLQTLLMYFTIKQEDKQAKLFKCLSKWLSLRGYYEFDQMAKDINEIRDNQ